jgi:hypothetical protein
LRVARKPGALLDATEKKLIHIQTRVRRAKKPLRGDDTHSGSD